MTDRQALLLREGWRKVQSMDRTANPPMLRTCGITDEAYLKSYARLGRILEDGRLGNAPLTQGDKRALTIALGAMVESCTKAGFEDRLDFRLRAGYYADRERMRKAKTQDGCEL